MCILIIEVFHYRLIMITYHMYFRIWEVNSSICECYDAVNLRENLWDSCCTYIWPPNQDRWNSQLPPELLYCVVQNGQKGKKRNCKKSSLVWNTNEKSLRGIKLNVKRNTVKPYPTMTILFHFPLSVLLPTESYCKHQFS